MNKFVKTGIIGGIIYGVSELWFAIGKGEALGMLAAGESEITPSECLDRISDDKSLTCKIISKYAKYEKEKLLKKIES